MIADHINNKLPRDNYKTAPDWQSAVLSELCDLLEDTQIFNVVSAQMDYLLNEALDLPNDIAISEQIDAKIHRTIKYLGQLKTMQSMGLGGRLSATRSKLLYRMRCEEII